MKRMFWVIGGLALMVGVVVVLVLSSREGQENMATVVEAVNKVDAHPHSKDDWQPAVVSMTIYGDGQVRTGAVSWARLELLEGTVRLSADSIFTVKESATRQGVLVTTLFLQEGRLWAHLTTNQPHEFAVETGNAVAAVRDTRFSVWVLGDVTLVSVAEGEVTLTAQGRRVTIHAGEQATVEGTQPPSLPEAMSDEERVLWAIEGEMPQLAPPTPTPTATETSTPTPTPTATATSTPTSTDTPTATPTCTCTLTPSPTPSPTPTHTSKPTVTPTLTPSPIPTDTPVRLDMKCDVNCYLWGPAGDPAARDPQTNILGYIRGGDAAQVAVKFPSGEVVVLPLSDVLGWPEQSFEGEFEGMPQAGGTYTCTFLDTDGNPIPGAVDSDVYLGGYEPDPPTNLRAEMVEAGVLVTWDPSPVIPGAFDPSGSPPWGQYHVSAAEPAARRLYIWATQGRPLAETSHLIPFRRQDFAPGAVGLPLEEWGDGVYLGAVHAGSWAPEGTNGKHMECTARDPAEDWWIVIEGGEVRVERP